MANSPLMLSSDLLAEKDYIEICSFLDTSSTTLDHYISTSYSSLFPNSTIKINDSSYQTYFDSVLEIFSPTSNNAFDNLFPPGVRFLSDGLVVYERPPCHKVVSFSKDYRDSINNETSIFEYYIPIPWQIYIAKYDPSTYRLVDVSMFFAKNSLRSPQDVLYSPSLPNFYANGALCKPFFPHIDDINKYSQDIFGVIASAYDWVWNSGYNYDIVQNINLFMVSDLIKQFEPYVLAKGDRHLAYYNHFVEKFNNKNYFYINYNSPDISNIEWLYKFWSLVPLEEISNFTWLPIVSNSWYNSVVHEELKSLCLDEFMNTTEYTYDRLTDLFGNRYPDDDEYCEDSCDCDDCIEYRSERDWSQCLTDFKPYSQFVFNKLMSFQITFDDAIKFSVSFLNQNRLAQINNFEKIYQDLTVKIINTFAADSSGLS